jgi:hypothetical protein
MVAPALGYLFAKMPPDDLAGLKTRARTHLNEDSAGQITYGAWANAIEGHLPL